MSELLWSNTNLNRILLSHATQNVGATLAFVPCSISLFQHLITDKCMIRSLYSAIIKTDRQAHPERLNCVDTRHLAKDTNILQRPVTEYESSFDP
jgi:hypothetical protein